MMGMPNFIFGTASLGTLSRLIQDKKKPQRIQDHYLHDQNAELYFQDSLLRTHGLLSVEEKEPRGTFIILYLDDNVMSYFSGHEQDAEL